MSYNPQPNDQPECKYIRDPYGDRVCIVHDLSVDSGDSCGGDPNPRLSEAEQARLVDLLAVIS